MLALLNVYLTKVASNPPPVTHWQTADPADRTATVFSGSEHFTQVDLSALGYELLGHASQTPVTNANPVEFLSSMIRIVIY